MNQPVQFSIGYTMRSRNTETMNDPFTRLNVIAMQIQGLWPVGLFGKKISVIHRTFGVFITLSYGLFTATMLADVIISLNDLKAVLRNLSITLLYFSGIAKATVFLFTRSTIGELVKHSGEFSQRIRRSGDPKSLKIFNEYVKYAALVTYSFWGGAGLTITGFCGAPIIEMILGAKEEPAQLIYKAWNPFPDLWSGYLLQLTMAYLTGVITASWSTLMSVLMIIPTCELRILKIELEGMVEGEYNYDDRNGDDLKDRIVSWLKRHVEVIRYVESLNGALNHILLLDFVTYAGICCTILFQYTVMDSTFESIVAVLYMIVIMMMLLMIYWTGNEIKLNSELLAEAAWNSTWYKAPSWYKTIICIIMHRCQNPLKVSVWKLYDVSMVTCLKICSAAYSYFAIIRHVYSEK